MSLSDLADKKPPFWSLQEVRLSLLEMQHMVKDL